MSWALCNARQREFIDAYIRNKDNGASSYMEAYNTTDLQSAASGASRLLTYDYVKTAVDERRAHFEAITGVDSAWRLKTLQAVAEAGLGTYIDKYGNERKEGLGAVVSAVSEINKMTGGHAPTKVAETDADGNDKPTGIEIKVVGVKSNENENESGDE
ncbi:terminase small subunit [Vibrio phage 1.123.O._10N.286.48.F3]|nr:terminase small subunit [Vibrio phage 1.123.O._10N.286.48.F3]